MTKMTDAFKKVFLGLGGNPKELAENNDVGDYIVDLEGAIKDYVNEAATHELPTPEAEDIGKIVSVVSDGDEGAEYDLTTPASGGGIKFIDVTISENVGGGYSVSFPSGVTIDTILTDILTNNLDVKLRDPSFVNAQSVFSLISVGDFEHKGVNFLYVSFGASSITSTNISYASWTNTWTCIKRTYTIQAS